MEQECLISQRLYQSLYHLFLADRYQNHAQFYLLRKEQKVFYTEYKGHSFELLPLHFPRSDVLDKELLLNSSLI